MKQLKLFKNALKQSDIALEIIDSRFIFDSIMEEIEKIVEKNNVKLGLIINKSDLLDKEDIFYFEKLLKEKNYNPFFVSSKERLGTKKVREWLSFQRKLLKKEKINVVVFGYPNVGKSSFLNIMKGKHSAGVSSIPNYTKGLQYIKINKWLKFIDTPGIILPIEEKKKVLLGIINPNSSNEDLVEYLWYLLKEIKEMKYGKKELKKFGYEERDLEEIEDWEEYIKILERIAKEKNYIIKGNKPDIGRFAKLIITNWQKGNIRAYKLY